MINQEEQRAIYRLMARGRDFTIAFLKDANVSEDTLAKIYYGQPIPVDELERVKRVLKERMTEDASKVGTGRALCPTCGALYQDRTKL